MPLDFELKAKDIGGRIGKLGINSKEIETPAIFPVYNPNNPLVSIDEFQKEFKFKTLMCNAYIILKNPELRKTFSEKGIHKALGFDGLVATDSGSYQLMLYGNVQTTNTEIIKFQEKIGTDIGSFLDIPTFPDAYKPRAEEQLEKTLERAKEAKNAKFVVNAGIQGSNYLDLRKRAAKEIGKNFELVAIGGIVRLMENYDFSTLVDIIATVKQNIPTNRVVHAFGLGHPMVFSLAAALGCDLFDSAAYALYAEDGRYLMEFGTKKLEELEYLPCECPVCSKYDVVEFGRLNSRKKTKELARHNLYVTVREIKTVKQAIEENRLWELLQTRARTHPKLFAGFLQMFKYKKWLSTLDLITKKSSFYYSGEESKNRTEIVNARKRIKNVDSKKTIKDKIFGKIPAEILDIYPFGPVVEEKPEIEDLEKIKGIMEYQFGKNASDVIKKVRIKKSRKTKRIRWIYENKDMIASVRASDHFIIPKKTLAERLMKKFAYPKLRVVVKDEEVVKFIKDGKSVFAKFVSEIDKDLRAGDECFVVDKDDNLIRIGTLVLAPREVRDFKRGVAVRIR